MTRETYRTIGALLGLGAGIAVTVGFGFTGQLIPSALFGAGGCVAGAVTAEKLHDYLAAKR